MYCIARNRISLLLTLFVVSFDSLTPWVVVFTVLIMPAKRKSLCPGCKTPKQNHAFAALSKDCAGPLVKTKILDNESSEGEELPPCQGKSVSSPSAESSPQKKLALQQLLDAIWNLSLQLKNQWKKSLPQTPPKPLARTQVTVQARALAILCCRLNKQPKFTIYWINSPQPPSMVSTWIFQRYYLL